MEKKILQQQLGRKTNEKKKQFGAQKCINVLNMKFKYAGEFRPKKLAKPAKTTDDKTKPGDIL